eukprot:SAG31_NODE_256_length_19032_cov_5.305181_4_plen_78_part_00
MYNAIHPHYDLNLPYNILILYEYKLLYGTQAAGEGYGTYATVGRVSEVPDKVPGTAVHVQLYPVMQYVRTVPGYGRT